MSDWGWVVILLLFVLVLNLCAAAFFSWRGSIDEPVTCWCGEIHSPDERWEE